MAPVVWHDTANNSVHRLQQAWHRLCCHATILWLCHKRLHYVAGAARSWHSVAAVNWCRQSRTTLCWRVRQSPPLPSPRHHLVPEKGTALPPGLSKPHIYYKPSRAHSSSCTPVWSILKGMHTMLLMTRLIWQTWNSCAHKWGTGGGHGLCTGERGRCGCGPLHGGGGLSGPALQAPPQTHVRRRLGHLAGWGTTTPVLPDETAPVMPRGHSDVHHRRRAPVGGNFLDSMAHSPGQPPLKPSGQGYAAPSSPFTVLPPIFCDPTLWWS